MTTQASIGYATIFSLHNGTELQEIGEVTNITPPNISVDVVDATHMVSEGAAREFIAGLIDYGEIKIEMNLVPGSDTDALIKTLIKAREAVAWQMTFPSPGSPEKIASGSAILTGYEPEAPLDDKMVATLSLKVTGPVTYS